MYIMLCTLSELFYIMEYYLIYIYKEVKAIYYECHKKNTHTDYLRTTGKCRI